MKIEIISNFKKTWVLMSCLKNGLNEWNNKIYPSKKYWLKYNINL